MGRTFADVSILCPARRNALAVAIAIVGGTQFGECARADEPEALPERIRIEVTGSRIARIDGVPQTIYNRRNFT